MPFFEEINQIIVPGYERATGKKAEDNFAEAVDLFYDVHLAKSTLSAKEMTRYIQKNVAPHYNFDYSEENLKKRKDISRKARRALVAQYEKILGKDKLCAAGKSIFDVGGANGQRAALDLGAYIGSFMDKNYQNELLALADLKSKNQTDGDYIKRKDALQKAVLDDAVSRADDMRTKFDSYSTEEMVDHFDELYLYSRICNTGDTVPKDLPDEERQKYYAILDPFILYLPHFTARVSVMAGPLGEIVDVDQLSQLSPEKLQKLKGEGAISSLLKEQKDEVYGVVNYDPFNDLIADTKNFAPQIDDVVLKKFNRAAKIGEKSGVVYQDIDGKEIDGDQMLVELMDHHRPIYAVPTYSPEDPPTLVYMEKGKILLDHEAQERFEEDSLPEPVAPSIAPEKVPGIGKPWYNFCGWLGSTLGLKGLAAALRTKDQQEYYEYEEELKEHEENKRIQREQSEERDKLKGADLLSEEKLRETKEKLYQSKFGKSSADYKKQLEDKQAEKEKEAEEKRRKEAEEAEKKAREKEERLTVEAALQSSGYSEAQAKGFTHLIELVNNRAQTNLRDNIERGQKEKNESYIRTGAALKEYYDGWIGMLQETRNKILENAAQQKTNPNVSLKVELPERVQEILKDLPEEDKKATKKKKSPDVIGNRLNSETSKITEEVDAVYYKEKEEKRKADIHEARRATNAANEGLSNNDLFALAMMQAKISDSPLPAQTQTKLNALYRQLINARLECKNDIDNILADNGQLTPEQRRHYAAVAVVGQRMEKLLGNEVDAITNGSKTGLSHELSELIGEGKAYSPEEFAESVKNALFNKVYDLSKSNEIETLAPTTEDLMRMVAPEEVKEAAKEQEVTTVTKEQAQVVSEKLYWDEVEYDEDDYEKEEENEKENEWKEEKRKGKMIEKANDAAENLQPMVQEASKFKEVYRKEAGFMERKGANMYNRMDHIAMKGLKIYQDAYSIINSIRNGDQSPDAPIPSEPLYMVALYEVTRQLHQAGDYSLENMMDNGLGSNGLCKAMKAVPQINDAFKDMTAEKFVDLVNKPDFMKFDNNLIGMIKVSAMATQKTMERNGTLKQVTQKPEKKELTQDQQTMYTKNTSTKGMGWSNN